MVSCSTRRADSIDYQENPVTKMMKAAIFIEPGRIELTDKPIPDVGPNDALVRITTTTICGTDKDRKSVV